MSDDTPRKRRPGRPATGEPKRRIHITVSDALLAQLDQANYSAFFEAAAREKLEREAAVPRRSGRPKRDATAGSGDESGSVRLI